MELNKDAVLEELTNFEKNYAELDDIPEILERYLTSIAQSGDILYSWSKFKPLIKKKIEIISTALNFKYPYDENSNLPNMDPFNFEELKKIILTQIDSFTGAPFTIQRLCELLTSPCKYYKRTDKFMRGLEKNVMVVSTIEPLSRTNDNNSTKKAELFLQPSTSEANMPPSSSNINGFKDIITDSQKKLNHEKLEINLSYHNISSVPLQQLDSFTTVFVSSPSTPLEIVSDMQIYETESSPSSEPILSKSLNSSQENLISINDNLNTRSIKEELSLEKNNEEIVNINKVYEKQKIDEITELTQIEKDLIEDLGPRIDEIKNNILDNNENPLEHNLNLKEDNETNSRLINKRECKSPEFHPKRLKLIVEEDLENSLNKNEDEKKSIEETIISSDELDVKINKEDNIEINKEKIIDDKINIKDLVNDSDESIIKDVTNDNKVND